MISAVYSRVLKGVFHSDHISDQRFCEHKTRGAALLTRMDVMSQAGLVLISFNITLLRWLS